MPKVNRLAGIQKGGKRAIFAPGVPSLYRLTHPLRQCHVKVWYIMIEHLTRV